MKGRGGRERRKWEECRKVWKETGRKEYEELDREGEK